MSHLVLYNLKLHNCRQKFDLREDELEAVEAENLFSRTLCKQINRIIINNMNKKYPHLCDAQVGIKMLKYKGREMR